MMWSQRLVSLSARMSGTRGWSFAISRRRWVWFGLCRGASRICLDVVGRCSSRLSIMTLMTLPSADTSCCSIEKFHWCLCEGLVRGRMAAAGGEVVAAVRAAWQCVGQPI